MVRCTGGEQLGSSPENFVGCVLIWGMGSSSKFIGCSQKLVPCFGRTEVPIFLWFVGEGLFSASTGHPWALATWTPSTEQATQTCVIAYLSLTSVSDLMTLRTYLLRQSPLKGIALSLTQLFRDHSYICKYPFVLSHNHWCDIPSYPQGLPTLKFKDVGHCESS